MKVAVLSLTAGLLATISWLVAGHAVGSTTQATAPTHVSLSTHGDDDADEHAGDFLGGGSALSNGVFEQRVMRSSGS